MVEIAKPESSIRTGGNIAVRHVSKTFTATDARLVHALDKVSLDINASEFVSLVGPSGCGKSTLLRLIAGLDRPDWGELLLDDAIIEKPDAERGLVFQDPTLYPWLTVQRNIRAGLVARGIHRGKNEEVASLIKLVGLGGFEKSYPHQLSGGMAQRVALARAIINHPKVLLLDEPLGALDAFTRMRMQDEVLRIWETRGTTMVLVTHDIDEAIYMSDRIVIMSSRPGRIETILDVPISRPRQRNNPAFLDLRTQILEMLHFAHRDQLEYYL
jgi:ABC-type nitrate/sulfonate/bicarbonate transport system ATPase subunit